MRDDSVAQPPMLVLPHGLAHRATHLGDIRVRELRRQLPRTLTEYRSELPIETGDHDLWHWYGCCG